MTTNNENYLVTQKSVFPHTCVSHIISQLAYHKTNL